MRTPGALWWTAVAVSKLTKPDVTTSKDHYLRYN